MPTPKAGYRLADGTRIPGVTTVISRLKDSGGLIHWAWQLGKDGKDYRTERDNAADAGTLAHAMVESHLLGVSWEVSPDTDKDVLAKAERAFTAYLDWARMTKVEIVATETPLVSERHRFGGTPDAIGMIDGKLTLLDWKSSNAVYGDTMIPQLAAYIELWNENHPKEPITDGAHLLRFSKTEADFAHHRFADVSDGWAAFQHMRQLYDLVAKLKKRA